MLNWILPPVLGAIIAFSTNWIAIVMLFRPHSEKRLFGWRIPFTPGLVPREKARLGRKLGEAISRHLLTPQVLTQALADPDRWPVPDYTVKEALEKWGGEGHLPVGDALKKAADYLIPKAAEAIRGFPQHFPALDERLAELTRHVVRESLSSLASIFVKKDKVYENIKEWLVEHLSDEANQEALRRRVHEAIDNLHANETLGTLNIRDALQTLPLHKILAFLAARVAQNMPIADMVEQKMATYDVAEAEAMILSVVGRELKIIVMLGGVFGFLIGLLSLIPLIS
ncbi:MAG: DUF445 family protein [Defluviitaleaceae bacterium]|nr:DUF445 family protein [Defluviitaleaceae bacterium]MCL2238551.1 DUF445 family protein [Defluviitaleaceae bacterium]